MFIPREKLVKEVLRKVGITGDLSFGHDNVVKKLQKLNGQEITSDVPQSVEFKLVDYSETYNGIQLVLGDKALRLNKIPYTVFPMIYNNSILAMDFSHPFPKVIGKVETDKNIEITAVQIKSTVLPMAVDSKSVLKKQADYESDVMDLTWFIMSGQAGTEPNNIMKFVQANIKFDDEEQENIKGSDFERYISQWYSTERLVEYHSELKPARVEKQDNTITLYVGSNDEKNEVKTIIIPSSEKISDDILIVNFDERVKEIFENM